LKRISAIDGSKGKLLVERERDRDSSSLLECQLE
jgi:hypothetical protein